MRRFLFPRLCFDPALLHKNHIKLLSICIFNFTSTNIYSVKTSKYLRESFDFFCFFLLTASFNANKLALYANITCLKSLVFKCLDYLLDV